MRLIQLAAAASFIFMGANCESGSKNAENLFGITITNSKKAYTRGDEISVALNNKKATEIDSVVYYLSELRANSSLSGTASIKLDGKVGKRALIAKIHSGDEIFEISEDLIVLSPNKPLLYTYNILEVYPHDIKAYTQGLEFLNDTLYESTGRYNQSSLRKTDYQQGKVLQKVPLGDKYFGEGLTIMNDKIYQLTWREKTGFVYDLNSMEQTGTFVYGQSQEGWGLCNDGSNIFKSDGTEKIWKLNSNTLSEEDHIEIYTNTSKIKSVNELEWIDGKIYANIYEKDAIAIVDPETGAVEGVINMKGLKEQVTQHDDLDVLNGIAYKGEPGILYVTGKNWDKLFKIEIVVK